MFDRVLYLVLFPMVENYKKSIKITNIIAENIVEHFS